MSVTNLARKFTTEILYTEGISDPKFTRAKTNRHKYTKWSFFTVCKLIRVLIYEEKLVGYGMTEFLTEPSCGVWTTEVNNQHSQSTMTIDVAVAQCANAHHDAQSFVYVGKSKLLMT
ncbi:hypothetical protein ACFE04_008360 [Oxalis oulophora]